MRINSCRRLLYTVCGSVAQPEPSRVFKPLTRSTKIEDENKVKLMKMGGNDRISRKNEENIPALPTGVESLATPLARITKHLVICIITDRFTKLAL